MTEEGFVYLIEPIKVLVLDSYRPIYRSNVLQYILPRANCMKKRYYKLTYDNKWIKDVKANLGLCGFDYIGTDQDLNSAHMEINSFYSVPRSELNKNYSVQELERYKMRCIQIVILPTLIQQKNIQS